MSVPARIVSVMKREDFEPDEFMLGDYRLSEIVRRVRRTADFSQRELARFAGVSPSVVGAIEVGRTPKLTTLQRVLLAGNHSLTVVDGNGCAAVPLRVWQDVADGAGRRYPAHLDTVLDPVMGEWWADQFGLAHPPETFRRSRVLRDYERRRSQWEVRVATYRHDPPPRRPRTAEWAAG